MKNTFCLLFVILIYCSAASAQKKLKAMAIAFYNVENLFHPADDPNKQDEDFTPAGSYHYTEDIYKKKLHNMASVIQQMGTDITADGAAMVCLAEVEDSAALRDLVLQPELATRQYRFIWFYGPDVRGISTALLYNPKYFTPLQSFPVHVPTDLVGQQRATRDVLYVKGLLPGSDTVHVLVNHWPSRRGGEEVTRPLRALAAGVNKRIADSVSNASPAAKIIIAGDLNDNPTDASVIKVLQAKADSTGLRVSDIYNPWIRLFKKGYGTEYHESWNLLDQIMVSGAFVINPNNKWKLYRYKIFNNDFLLEPDGAKGDLPKRTFTADGQWNDGFSDHLPVVTYFIHQLQ